ncbi:MAG: IPT/TIG domain-containing protein [Chitinophagaceae bacterium]
MTRSLHPLLLMLLLLTGGVIWSSCEKDDEKESSLVELLNFGPTGARHGDTIRFFGRNLDQVTSIQFSGTGAAVEKSDFKVHTPELILLLVPSSAEEGLVTLKTTQGDIVSKTRFNLNVLTTITSMTSAARPGANITINGTYLNWIKRVTFADDKLVETFVSQSFDQLVITVPADAKTGPLILAYGGTDSSDFETDEPLEVILPQATAISPNPIKHQENLTITGTDLDLTTKLYFTGVSTPVTSFVSQTATQLVVQVPAGATKGALTLEAASAVQTTTGDELVLTLPNVTGMAPNPVDPGANLILTGTDLDLVTSIGFENAAPVTSFVSQSATQIEVTVPMGVLRGQLTLGVLNSTVTVKSADVLEITGSAPPPTVALPFYDDAVTSNWTSTGWIGGGWGGTADYNNGSPVRAGSKSIRIDYSGGYGSPVQLGGASVNMSSYTHFKLSIYGAPGSGGKRINLGINANDAYTITIVEGEWTDYAIPISTLTGASVLNEIWVKEYSGTGGFTIYVDAMGLN